MSEVKDATETEELVGASSDRLEQDGSGVQQLREEDETGDPSEEAEVQQVCKPVLGNMQLYSKLCTQHTHTNSSNHTCVVMAGIIKCSLLKQ